MAPVRTVRRQVCLVRRRSNLREVQHAAFLSVGLLAMLASVTIPLAVRAGPGVFAAGVSVAMVTVAVGCGLFARRARRRWLTVVGAARWVDRTAGLQDRIESALTARAPGSSLLPVLQGQAVASMPRWTPRRMVPRPIAAGPLLAAGLAIAGLGLMLAVAPRLQPTLPEVATDGTVEGAGIALPSIAPTRVVAGRQRGGTTDGRPELDAGGVAAASGEGVRISAVERFAAALQSRMRDRLLGEGWRRAAAATSPARASDRGGAHPSTAPRGTGDAATWTQARLPVNADGGGSPSRPDPARGTWVEAEQRDAAAGPAPEDVPPAAPGGPGSPGHGAGTGTDPNLYGRPSETVHAAADPFALGITARVRAAGVGPRPPMGDAPAAEADARPGLGGTQRHELPVRRLDVPADLEPLVRTLFAHREEGR